MSKDELASESRQSRAGRWGLVAAAIFLLCYVLFDTMLQSQSAMSPRTFVLAGAVVTQHLLAFYAADKGKNWASWLYWLLVAVAIAYVVILQKANLSSLFFSIVLLGYSAVLIREARKRGSSADS